MKPSSLHNLLQRAIQEANLKVDIETQQKLVLYIELLEKWNAIHNLTAIREPIAMLNKHVLDSLVVLPHLPSGQRIVDVGTGAGLPGIPLALAEPQRKMILIDSNQKKINFVQHMILSLKLENAVAVCTRVERYKPEDLCDIVISRAFASLEEFVQVSHHLCKPHGRLIAMKGAITDEELFRLPSGFSIECVKDLSVNHATSRSLVFIAAQ